MPKAQRQKTRTAGVYKLVGARGTSYEAVWRAVNPDTGRRQQYSETFGRLEQAEAHLDKVKQARREGTFIPASRGKRTFGELFEEWLAAPRSAGPLKERTKASYRGINHRWLSGWQHRPVNEIKKAQVLGVIGQVQAAGRRAQTLHNVFTVIHGVLGHAVDTDCLAVNPAQRMRRKLQSRAQVRERVYLDAGQVAALAGDMPAPWGLLVRLAAWSGLRFGELGGLRARDVDTLRGRVFVREAVVQAKGGPCIGTPKSGRSRREVPIPPALARELGAHIAAGKLRPDDRLFPDPDGGLLRHEHFYRCHWRPARTALGLPTLRFHDLRHTYASLMHAQGRSMLEVSRWMGHSTYQLTADTYSHLWDGEDETLSTALDAAYLGATTNVVRLRTA